jgi:hypothetical protein
MEKPQFPAPKPRIDFVGEHIVHSPQSQVLEGNHGLSHNPNIISIKQLANPGVKGWDSETSPFSVPSLGKSTILKLLYCMFGGERFVTPKVNSNAKSYA